MTNNTDVRGIPSLRFTQEEARHPLFKKFVKAFAEEREELRAQLEAVQNIESTTLLRGQLHLVKRISARTSEVGPESRQSEADGPESATPARAATGFPVSFENQ